MSKPVRVVVADDSPFTCQLLATYLQSSPEFLVVGVAQDGAQVINLIRELGPDLVTLDLNMPGMSGMEALDVIMSECPLPVVVVSGVSRQAAELTLRALDHGAVDFIFKYLPGVDTDPIALREEIISKARVAAQIKVVRSIHSHRELPQNEDQPPPSLAERAEKTVGPFFQGNVIVIGASTGGPVALRTLVCSLPDDFQDAVVIVQHMPPEFTRVFAAHLEQQARLKVKEAQSGDPLRPGAVLVAPGGYHLLFSPDGRVELNQGVEIAGHRPSIDVTMQSAAQVFGAHTRGIVLTGMGEDGSLGLLTIRSKGGKTFAQDEQSSIVYGMPQRAIKKGLVDYVAPPAEIARLLCSASG
jgi:two-component system, chemotaxis family, protein-glutamate methylesterase/glutaminase